MNRSDDRGCGGPQVGLPDAGRTKRFLPFSDGKRDCVGQAMARMNYTSTLARLLAHFCFELATEVCARHQAPSLWGKP